MTHYDYYFLHIWPDFVVLFPPTQGHEYRKKTKAAPATTKYTPAKKYKGVTLFLSLQSWSFYHCLLVYYIIACDSPHWVTFSILLRPVNVINLWSYKVVILRM